MRKLLVERHRLAEADVEARRRTPLVAWYTAQPIASSSSVETTPPCMRPG